MTSTNDAKVADIHVLEIDRQDFLQDLLVSNHWSSDLKFFESGLIFDGESDDFVKIPKSEIFSNQKIETKILTASPRQNKIRKMTYQVVPSGPLTNRFAYHCFPEHKSYIIIICGDYNRSWGYYCNT